MERDTLYFLVSDTSHSGTSPFDDPFSLLALSRALLPAEWNIYVYSLRDKDIPYIISVHEHDNSNSRLQNS